MSNGREPIWANISPFSRRSARRPIYITFVELYQWAFDKTNSTQEGEPYHDAISKLQNAMKAIASLFDGSLGTFTDPISQTQLSYPTICDWNDIFNMYCDDYKSRLVAMPLFDPAYTYTQDNDLRWYNCLTSFCGRIERYVKFNTIAYKKFLATAAMKYNPISDYWTKSLEKGGNAPKAGIIDGAETTDGKPDINSWSASNNGDTAYGTSSSTSSNGEINNYTTTYDDASNSRLAGRQSTSSSGSSSTSTTTPNNAYFVRREEEGFKGTSPQDILEKEIELSRVYENIVHAFCEELNKEIFLSTFAKG